MNRQTIATIILVVILSALGALWYFYYASNRSAEEDTAPDIDIAAYASIKNLHLDVALLNNPVFRELKQEVIVPPLTESVGRSNPFLPF